jgi:hypothetical protein
MIEVRSNQMGLKITFAHQAGFRVDGIRSNTQIPPSPMLK